MVELPGQEPYLEPFWTKLHSIHGDIHDRALITSPEYAMKKLLAQGHERIYDLGPSFRDYEPWDKTHSPEFIMLEWYRKGADIQSLMDETEEMVKEVSQIEELQHTFRRITVADSFEEYAGIHLASILEDREAIAALVLDRGGTVHEDDSWDDLFYKIFLTEVEPKLGWDDDKKTWRPTFLWNYPISQAALAEKNPDDTRFALRAELYIGDLELGNGFQELTDGHEQRNRFHEEIELRKSLGKKTWAIDEELLKTLPNIGKVSGMAFGVDRFVMLLTGVEKLTDLTRSQ